MASFVLPFEKPVVDLIEKVRQLRALAASDRRFEPELLRLEEKTSRLARELFADLTPMQKVQLSRHANRPYTLDYIRRIFTDWVELKGDRRFAEDAAIVAGLASYHGRSVVIVGHQKGRGTKENVKRNFGMPHPEGYRKALRLMRQAEKFGRPVVTFIDTPGAYPGIGSEERGIGEAIAFNLREMARLRVPLVSVVIGEGMSGGALGIGVTDRILMLEHSIYSVISPEGCAAILWRSAEHREDAARALRLTAKDLLHMGICDQVIREPQGGAHADWDEAAAYLADALDKTLAELSPLPAERLLESRWAKYDAIGAWREA